MRSTLTLEQIFDLFDRHVPKESRSDVVLASPRMRAERISWWPAHELGHLAVAKPSEVFEPLFGLDDNYRVSDHYAICKELAAMRVGEQLLRMTPNKAVVDLLLESERTSTESDTLTWPTFGLTTRMLRAHSAERIPQTFKALDGYFAAKVEAGRLWVARRAKHARRGHARIGASLRAYA